MLRFLKAYIKSMRLYYAFITGIAGWLGMAFYEYMTIAENEASMILPGMGKKVVILSILFLSWGINQIINDFLGLKEDRINAPKRPMVTGELHARGAVLLSVALLIFSLTVILIYLEPIAVIPAIVGVLLNVVYEYAKGYGIFGNIVFGLMIAMSTVVGFFAAGPLEFPYITKQFTAIFTMVAVLNGLMTFYTYFKDYAGDKAAGKKTIVVKFGPKRSGKIALFSAMIPAMVLITMLLIGVLDVHLNKMSIFLAVITLFLQLWTGFLYYKYPEGERAYYSLSANFRACACGQAALVAFFNPELASMLFLATYIFVGFLFDLHADSKA